MYFKSKKKLETIYEDEEETNIIDDRSCQTTTNSPRTRFSCYVCWSLIGGGFFLITLFIAFSLNPFYSIHSFSKSTSMKIFNDDIEFSTPTENQFQSSEQTVAFIDHFSEKINNELNLPPQTISIFTLRIANDQFWRENQLVGIYFHLDFPQFCLDNQQCRENFQTYLNETMTKFSTKISFLSLNSMEFVHCNSIDNATSTTSVGFVSIKTTDVDLTDSVDHLFCEEIDHYYLLFSLFDHSQRHQNLFNMAINSNNNEGFSNDECSNHSQNDDYDHQEKSMSCNSKTSLPNLFLWNSY